MAYLVRLTSRAQRDLANLFQDVHAANAEAAFDWYRGLREAILSLEELPKRCTVIRQKEELRQLLYGHKPHVYRIIFRVLSNQKCVEVIHVRHGARRKRFGPEIGLGDKI